MQISQMLRHILAYAARMYSVRPSTSPHQAARSGPPGTVRGGRLGPRLSTRRAFGVFSFPFLFLPPGTEVSAMIVPACLVAGPSINFRHALRSRAVSLLWLDSTVRGKLISRRTRAKMPADSRMLATHSPYCADVSLDLD
jgi:hypothetical protein